MGSIRIVTEIPGPKSRAAARKTKSWVAAPVVPLGEIFVAGGKGAVLKDLDGNSYLDFIGGVGCLICGHAHPKVIDAVSRQSAKFTHTDFSLLPYELYPQLAQRLISLCGGGYKAAFFNSGAEAVENAVKVARGATGRPGIVCFEGAFHGRTFMALSLTSREVPHKQGFGPFASDIHRVSYPGFERATLEDSLDAVRSAISKHEIGGLIVEPVLGEGGFVIPPKTFLAEIAAICRENEVVFIADEIQTGYGRTGTFLASEQAETRPDVVILGKSISAGLPLTAVLAETRWIDSLEQNALGGTYVGNPVACAAALAVLDVIEGEDLIRRAARVGERLVSGWTEIEKTTDDIREVRGLGSMIGVEFASGDIARRVVQEARNRGVLLMTAGKDGSVLRHLMPLVITDDQLDEALDVFAKAVES